MILTYQSYDAAKNAAIEASKGTAIGVYVNVNDSEEWELSPFQSYPDQACAMLGNWIEWDSD